MSDLKPVLAVVPEVRRYSALSDDLAGEDAMISHLQSQRDTQPIMIHHVEETLLDDMGRIQGEYRLTTTALSQLCTLLATGLAPLLQNISGIKKRTDKHPDEPYSITDAIYLLNGVLRLRFPLLQNRCCFITDRRNKLIEGVVGSRYYLMHNIELYQRVRAFVESSSQPATFMEGAVSGRRLQLRYKNSERAFAIQTPTDKLEPFYAGWHFANSELGDCCIKGTSLIYRPWSGMTAIHPYGKDTKLVHLQGPTFDDKFRGVLDKIRQRVEQVPDMESRMTAMSRRNLGMGMDPKGHKVCCAFIASCLTKGGLRRQLAEEVVTHVEANGSYRADRLPVTTMAASRIINPNELTAVSTRNVYDVYNALTSVARRFHPEQQEVIEQIAFRVLNKTISIIRSSDDV